MIKVKMKTISIVLATLIASTALVGCKTISANEQSNTKETTNESASNVKLEKLNWSKDNYTALENVIENNGKSSKNYLEDEKPYAVFDWVTKLLQ